MHAPAALAARQITQLNIDGSGYGAGPRLEELVEARGWVTIVVEQSDQPNRITLS
jgi:hypothetical protein